MADLTIGEVARRAGVRTSALRYYEEAGILPRAGRVNGQRRYSEDLVNLVEVARFARSVGFSLSEIKRLFSGMQGRKDLRAQWRPLAHAKLGELDLVIARALRMKSAIESGLECGCIRVEDCLPGTGKSASKSPRRKKRDRR
jgi:MerR family transcriptional regulator, redox-sensitive transcriptional activator SoxR